MITRRGTAHRKPPRTTVADAVAAAERGWHVFPIREGTKLPLVKWVTEQDYTNDPDEAAGWFRDGDNIGVALGPSGLLVIDPDRHVGDGVAKFSKLCRDLADDGEWPDTLTVHTAGNGYHLYFHNPNGYRSATGLPADIDFKGSRTMVLAPGSVIDGKQYKIEHEAPVADLPAWLEKVILAPKPPAKRYPGRAPMVLATMPKAKLHAKIDAILGKVTGASRGERNSILHWASCRMGEIVAAGRISEAAAEAYLSRSAHTCGLLYEDGEYAVNATIRSGLRGGA
jgi:Bifunctional DNA primase/polymerase, N-terminal